MRMEACFVDLADEAAKTFANPVGLVYSRTAGISRQIRTKLRDWVDRVLRASSYAQAALPLTDAKTQ